MDTRVLKRKIKKLPIHPTFILFFLWFLINKNLSAFFVFCLVIFTHELGHYFVAKKLGYKLDSFFIAPYGISLNYKEPFFEQKDEIAIAAAGPIVNITLSLISISLWWIFPTTFVYLKDFVFQSFMLGLFNLLPCYPLDGGRILVGLISKNHSRKWAIKLTMILNICFSMILLILFFVMLFINFNPSLCFCAVFLFLSVFDSKYECSYQPAILYKKKTKDFSKPFFYAVNSNVELGQLIKKIEPNKFTVFLVIFENSSVKTIDENKVIFLSMKYDLNLTLEEIFR